MITGRDGLPVRLNRPNPLLRSQSGAWGGGIEENFDALGEVYVEKGSPAHAPDIETFMAMEEMQVEDVRANPEPEPENQEGPVDMLRNPNGTPYKLGGNADNYDPDNPDHDLHDSVDQEMIKLSGAPIEYYRVIVDGKVDPLYHEQRQKIFLTEPVRMKAVYEPATPTISELAGIGLTSEETVVFSFNRTSFLAMVGELPRRGSLIKTCDEGVLWEILSMPMVNIPGEDRKMWGKHRVNVVCGKYQSTATDRSPSGLGRDAADSGRQPINVR